MATIDGETFSAYVTLKDKVREIMFNFSTIMVKLDISVLERLMITLSILQEQQFINQYVNECLVNLSDAILEIKVEVETVTRTSQVLKNLSSHHKRLNGVINSKLQKLIERLEWFRSVAESKLDVSNDKSSIYGRDNDIKKLKNLLLSEDASDGDCKVRIISIVGMGGVGKTTLAKLLYNNLEVKERFGVRGWVVVSKDFDIFRVLETILESITSQGISSGNLNSQPLEFSNTKINDTSDMHRNLLLVKLQQILSTTNFLLLLDDVWDTNSVDWIYLMDVFNAGKMGSRIIITTRDERVARSMQIFLSVHYLRPLESEDCWSLVARHAFGTCSDIKQSNLEEIGRKIAKKCDGLPSAAIKVGALLRTNLSPNDWNYVLECNILKLIGYGLHANLQLSYSHLSTPLKGCFAYCSIFPKESVLEKMRVVQLWIAEGLVESSTDHASLEKVGEEYFDILVSRSLIQRRSIDDEEEIFEMNNLIHDLATMVASQYCIRLDEQIYHVGVRNLSYNRGLYDSFNKFHKLFGFKGLRTFLALPLQKQLPLCLLSNKVVNNLLPKMKWLCVLSLSNYKSITKVPKSIGNLVYLQYFNLSHTNIERLPSETCNLYNLQFLLLLGCKRLIELPEDMGKLVNLRHLDVNDTALTEMPVQIAKLENLHTLSNFVVSKHIGGLKIAELGKFPHLHGKLSISQMQNVNDPFEAFQANMKMKEQLDELALEWNCCSTSSNSQIQSVVLEHLRPSTNLKNLTIKGYGGISFSNWLGDSLFRNMVYLRISSCDHCLWLPPLGQLGNLKKLIIEGMQSVETIGVEFYAGDVSSFQPFPSLETLHFEDMQEWEEWNLIEGTTTEFPSLKTLSLSKCPKLRVGNIADKFPSLTELELRECPLLVQSVRSSGRVLRQLMLPLNCLQQLTIDGFPFPVCFPTDGLPKTLKFLKISNCENLEFLPHEYLDSYTSLEELKISYSCNSMISFTLGALPVLKSLFIEGCKNLKSILIAEDMSEKSLSFLRSIKIWDCNELESFPPGRLATPNLVYIAVWKCEKLHSLPEAMNSLNGLQELEIDNLPNLQSFAIDDLPSSLRELTVGSVGGIMWNTDTTWEHLTCLSVLRINGADTVKTLMRPLLPKSLVTLCIRGLNDKSIDGKWFQHLTFLQNLEIVNAPKLKSLPKEGLPSSLSVLSITRCPLLVAKLQRKRGKEWRKIAHIPAIVIDDELIT
ncbi:putative P-loop containing nucleoside triphosphate hydrolase, leucine-rich repeat domain, L [Medicago truncatula]|uniref:Putative P-loop containing nucleoside triphosphate hydrolase, leucine-rich repeat domain, L n=1 Tax=Medicago truncatula TaxID=3880 RepID=A0A396I2D9_MEDTR|nr:putative disease resistance protein At3g14460 [Medicago truncatula]RHN58991.1 putative P-loop containing nucleoside triphosphate hydrolase, leucine-rich repeat domain, L [Medicago truncatula]